MRRRDVLAGALALSLPGTRAAKAETLDNSFGAVADVTIRGYDDDAMEPFITRDGKLLLFNNRNDPPEKTDLHWAERIDDLTFAYRGPIDGANSGALDGVASLSASGELFFVSTRSYGTSFSTIYHATFDGGRTGRPTIVPGVSRDQPGWVNFDVEVSADGNTLYFVDSWFGRAGKPQIAGLKIAVRDGDRFRRLKESDDLMDTVNAEGLNFGACISVDECELFFTRVAAITADASPAIYRAARAARDQPFGPPQRISAITGFAEAPTLAPDGKRLYFHARIGDRYVIRSTQRLS